MFDSEQIAELDASATMSLVSGTHRLVLEQECLLVQLAAHWCDLHSPDSQPATERTRPGAERGQRVGGEGTAEVLEFSAAELGAQLETTAGSAKALMADALDLRHRLPELWQLVCSGRLRVWRARRVAQATRHLGLNAAMHVDSAVAPAIVSLPWQRFETMLQAKIIEADPKAADEQAEVWEAERFVRTGRTGQSGLKLLIAKANAGDVIWFLATVNRIAEILRLQGDLDSADVRRSKAIGILAQPALALDLLWQFRDEQRPAAEPQQPDEPVDNDPRAPFDRSTSGPTDNSLPDSLVVRPSGLDQRRLRPQVVLHIHLGQEALLASVANGAGRLGASGLGGGVARMEGVGPVTLEQVRRFLGQTSCKVTVQPVIDPVDVSAVDGYEIPRRIKEAMFLRMPASCFPYAAGARRMDLDHTKPYLPPARGGPPGQTGIHNLGPLTRTEHRIKTHSRWRLRQPEPGVWLWRSPHGAHYLVTDAGTYNLGQGAFARTVWRAATRTNLDNANA